MKVTDEDGSMTRAALILLSIGTALFVALRAWHGVGSVAATLAVAGWGLAVVTLFHTLPLGIDAAALASCSTVRPRPPR